jgi:hypothetical protein
MYCNDITNLNNTERATTPITEAASLVRYVRGFRLLLKWVILLAENGSVVVTLAGSA